MSDAVDLEALADLRTPWCLHVVATLRIAQHMVAGRARADELAAAAGCDAWALTRVLEHLAGKGVFTEVAPGRFALADGARGLLEEPCFLALDGIGGRLAEIWSTLPAFVATGRSAYAERYGRGFWEDLEAHPALAASFDDLMGPAGHGVPVPLELEGGHAGVRHVVDVGGGTGTMLAAILEAHAHLRGTLVELPGTIARAAAVFAAAGLDARVTLVAQSFFDPLPAGGDVYVLRKVLNDWPEAETVAILRRCAEALAPGGRVVVTGGVAPETEGRGLDVEMLLVGGRTDRLETFRERARAAGLEVTSARRQASGAFVVECVRREGERREGERREG
jgi:SAM-dependent methyltransferase